MTVESSPTNQDAVQAAATDANQAAANAEAASSAAQSSGADGSQGAKPATSLDAVTAALASDGADGSTPDPNGKAEESKAKEGDGKPGDAAPELSAEDKDADGKPLPFHKHPRWQEMRGKIQTQTALLKEYAPKVEFYDHFHTTMRESGLNADEANTGFNIMALMKNNPAQAWTALKPYVDALQAMVGETLPDDIRKDVEEGRITEDRAKELAKLRGTATHSQDALKRTKEQSEADAKAQAVTAIRSAVSEWEAQWRASDPDYAKKQPFVDEYVRAHIAQNGPPKSPADATELAKAARKAVEDRISAIAPQKPPAVAPGTNGSSATARPAPKSSLDVVSMALGS